MKFMQHFWDLKNLQLLVCHVGQVLCLTTNILLKIEKTHLGAKKQVSQTVCYCKHEF